MIESDLPGTIVFSADGTFSTSYNQAAIQTVSTTRNDSTTPWYTTEVTALETGLTVSNEAGEATVTARGRKSGQYRAYGQQRLQRH